MLFKGLHQAASHQLASLARARAPHSGSSLGLLPKCHMAAAAGSGDGAPAAPRAALLAIGDELLKGSIADANTPWLAKLLYSRGVDLVRVEFVPDDKAEIGASLQALRDRVGPGGFVFTSGGIGPTHDDMTYEAIAGAFGLGLEVHEETRQRMLEHYTPRGLELNAARLRMATLPTPCEVLVTPGMWVPLACVAGNVYVLPGIPRLFQQMVTAHAGRFSGPASHQASLASDQGEGDLAGPLAEVAAAHPAVSIGSYPHTGDPGAPAPFKVKLAFSSRDAAALAAAVEAARAALPALRALPA